MTTGRELEQSGHVLEVKSSEGEQHGDLWEVTLERPPSQRLGRPEGGCGTLQKGGKGLLRVAGVRGHPAWYVHSLPSRTGTVSNDLRTSHLEKPVT